MSENRAFTEHEEKISGYLMELDGLISGFPDTERRFANVVRAVAGFASTKPQTHFKIGDGTVEIIPAEWLMKQIQLKCHYWPSIAEIREIYCDYFKAQDGHEPGEILTPRRRASSGESE